MSNYRVRQAMVAAGWGWPKDEQLLLIALATYLGDGETSTDRVTNKGCRELCGFPHSSLHRARRGLVKRGAIKYEAGNGREHPSIYTVLCLPGEPERVPADGTLSKEDRKGTAQTEPSARERVPNTGKKGTAPSLLPAETDHS